MLIRLRGYNDGAKEYLEEGAKAGREQTRDELDERVILYGDLDLTQRIYQSIPDTGQERYLSYTLAFKEDLVSHDTLHNVTTEFKQFLLHAYKEHEINFYAEAHLPKIKQMRDRKTGEMVERKPHIHIIIPRKNMFTGNEANPAGMHGTTTKYMEAFQEYINQKYNLASPRENVRFNPKDSASVLSRYKGDDFYGKNREFKQDLVKQIVDKKVLSRADFYSLVAEYGDTRIRNQGKENEYIAVKLPDDAKFTNLKDTIFQDDFLLRRQLKKPPLDQRIIQERLHKWPQVARELKYVAKATPSFRELYKQSTPEQQTTLLEQREHDHYREFGEHHDGIHLAKRPRNRQRSAVEAGPRRTETLANGVQDLPGRSMANHGQADGQSDGTLLLSGDARVHLEPATNGRDPGLRAPLRERGRGRGRGTRPSRAAGVPAGAARQAGGAERTSAARNRVLIPPYARSPHRVASVGDIEAHSTKLLGPLREPVSVAPDGPDAGQRKRPRKARRAAARPGSKVPPYARSLHRVATVVDVDAHSARLLGPLRQPQSRGGPTEDRLGQPQEPSPRQQRRSKIDRSKKALPPYARNPNRVANVADIEAHSRRLLSVLTNSHKPAQVFKTQITKPIAINRSASTVAASLSRALEQSQLLPAQRSAIRRVDNQFYALRHFVYADERLTRQDKAQLFSVLTFERLKAREAIKHPKLNNEVSFMGSASIRDMLTEEEPKPEFSISGPAGAKAPPIRERVKLLVGKLAKDVEPETAAEKARALQAADLYTKKARFSNNVHYVDKKTDKTVFIDTGTSIALRRTGINEAGVALALQMAQQRFGSTLTINGSAEFKHLVIEAAAKNNMDIHFTDKGMNQQLADRRAELELERDGHKIQQPTGPELAAMATSVATAPAQASAARPVEIFHNGEPVTVDPNNATDVATVTRQLNAEVAMQSERIEQGTQRLGELENMLANHSEGREPEYKNQLETQIEAARNNIFASTLIKNQATQSLTTLSTALAALQRPEALSRANEAAPQPVQASQQEAATSAVDIIHNGESVQVPLSNVLQVTNLTRQLNTEISVQSERIEQGTQRLGELENMLANHSEGREPEYKDQLETQIEAVRIQLYTATGLKNQATQSLTTLTTAALQHERAGAQPVAVNDGPKPIQGALLDHGSAPYKHDEANESSYFVSLKTPQGVRTVWGAGLEELMQKGNFQQGERISLQDKGTEPVKLQLSQDDGSVIEKDAYRRVWEVESNEPEMQTPAVVTTEIEERHELDIDN